MGTAKTNPKWCVFDTIKKFPQTSEALMAEINSAISSLEYTHSTALLKTPPFPPTPLKTKTHFDAKMADEAYKEGLASLASGKLDEAIHSLNTSLLKCPPNQTSAVAKLQSLIAVTSKQLKSNPNN